MADDREELGKLAYELQMYRDESQILQQQIASLQTTQTEIEGSIETLKNIKDIKDEVLLPIGSGAHLRAKILDNEKILVGIGADVIAEKGVEEAREFLAARSKKIEDLKSELQKNLIEISNRMVKLDEEAKRITNRMRRGKDLQPSQEDKGIHQEYR